MTAEIVPFPMKVCRRLDLTLSQEDFVRGMVMRAYMHEPPVCVGAACDTAGMVIQGGGSPLEAIEEARVTMLRMKKFCETKETK